MEQAHRQAGTSNDNDDIMATITRSQYVHSLTLLLRSLPSSLTPVEQMSLHDAIPRSVLDLHEAVPQSLIQPHTESIQYDNSERTVLWNMTAWLVFKLFLLLQLLAPYIKHFAQCAAQFESEHQITRRVFNTGIAVGGGISRECWKMSRAVCLMNDGMLGDVVSDAVGYCAESIGGGIQQGIAQARSQQGTGRRRKGRRVKA
jgi:hypothetical protein